LFAALGGLLLNLMPCVFPVIGLKVLGFAQSDADEAAGRQSMRRGGFAFAGGVLVSFWVLGGLMLALRAAGDAVGWGFQLQSPGFVAAMSLLFLLIGLNFSGLYEFGLTLTRLGGVGSGTAKGSSAAGAFAAGALAVLVATPCTAPFMGSALGLTLTQPAWQAMSIFTAIGLGMALPYALLGAYPHWLKALPRPGRWMQTLREALAFPMYASAAWLAWVLARQAGADAVLRLLLAAVVMAAGAWAWGRFSTPPAARLRLALMSLLLAIGVSFLLLAPLQTDASGQASPGSSSASGWQDWSEARVEQALAQGRPVFVDFTAAWCVTCQANKQLVLERQAVSQAFERAQVVLLRADWTRRDPVIAAALAQHGRNGVPLYLLYRPNQPKPVILPELLTVATVLEALR
jgi:thiol:disulfide interchange protein DsbD